MTDKEALIERVKALDFRGSKMLVAVDDLRALISLASPAQWPEDVVERVNAIARIIDYAAFDWGETPWGPLSNLQTGHKQRWSRLGPAIADHRDEGKRRRERALTTAGEILATLVSPEGATRDQIAEAWIDGATAVHNAWIEGNGGREADFTEAAHDYADSLPTPPEDERVKGLIDALEFYKAEWRATSDAYNPRGDAQPTVRLQNDAGSLARSALASYRGQDHSDAG